MSTSSIGPEITGIHPSVDCEQLVGLSFDASLEPQLIHSNQLTAKVMSHSITVIHSNQVTAKVMSHSITDRGKRMRLRGKDSVKPDETWK
jgi:hypothetical protein